ncbi:erythroblast NAD(P)(+)--arginine ADP-ribosyltransferase-like [Sardina pilchardus]|uniref:erythroblast NAD(P)(+)--arginine ADP-ribosyltransferase-like n=1 Tax=Sardina pilchardus TaxID=27697 RepID=UPI002E142AA1
MKNFAVLILILITGAFLFFFGKETPLDMAEMDIAENSVDDQYQGCPGNMSRLVENSYLKDELKTTKNFTDAWSKGEKWCSSNTKGDDLGEMNYCIALYVYTLDEPPIYKVFNSDTHSGGTQYTGKTYQWHSLHFLLTRALQALKDREKQEGAKCRLTYRGTDDQFNKDILNKEVRFGFFSSSSMDRKVAEDFGKKSCFEINTCHGAKISDYSASPQEREVLIPPYEKFKVSQVSEKIHNPGLWCDTVYKLESTGIRSDLNCAVVARSFDRVINEL